ncbi:MAG: HIT domain-containing protein [Phycisphaerae bacterium]
MADFNENLWAPWRMEYIRSLGDDVTDDGCFLCRYWAAPDDDAANHVVWRGASAFVVMNRFPYTNGHLLVAVASHVGDMSDLSRDELAGLTVMIRDALGVLTTTIGPHGFNIGFNIGRCAGAGLPDHLHAHIVPRWRGDTNYMAVLGGTRVIPEALDTLYRDLRRAAVDAGLGARDHA